VLGERQRASEVLPLLFDLRKIIEEIRNVRRIHAVSEYHQVQRLAASAGCLFELPSACKRQLCSCS
jgi:hypothetical protein